MARANTLTFPASEWPDQADKVADLVLSGQIVLFPTETVYGIGTAATDEGAKRLALAKGRPEGKPFQVLIADMRILEKWSASIDPAAEKLIEAFWPGPMTLVLEVDSGIVPRALAPSGAVGFRMPNHDLCLDLIRRAGGALAATSANPGGGSEARTCMEAVRAFHGKLAAAIDAGTVVDSQPSTVVSVKSNIVTVLRNAAISEETIMETVEG